MSGKICFICSNPSKSFCANCETPYCSNECADVHWYEQGHHKDHEKVTWLEDKLLKHKNGKRFTILPYGVEMSLHKDEFTVKFPPGLEKSAKQLVATFANEKGVVLKKKGYVSLPPRLLRNALTRLWCDFELRWGKENVQSSTK